MHELKVFINDKFTSKIWRLPLCVLSLGLVNMDGSLLNGDESSTICTLSFNFSHVVTNMASWLVKV